MPPITREQIDACFQDQTEQWEVFKRLYDIPHPGVFERPVILQGWPEVSNTTTEYIWNKFMEFDKEHHPEVMAGGLWMNSGFTVLPGKVPDWWIEPAEEIQGDGSTG